MARQVVHLDLLLSALPLGSAAVSATVHLYFLHVVSFVQLRLCVIAPVLVQLNLVVANH